jgi:hypothetical protein
LNTKANYIREVTSPADFQEFKELKNPLVPLQADFEQKLAALDKDKANGLELLANFIFEANQAGKWVKEEN